MPDAPVILVVEDDYQVQEMIREALTEAGFPTTVVSSAEEALSVLGPAEHKALVTDINLGGRVTGWDVATRARQNDPALPVVYMTGDPSDEWASRGVPNSILLEKPFAPAQVVTAVAQLLNLGGPSSTTA